MTLTYAVIAKGGIVLAADSQCTATHQLEGSVFGTYLSEQGKIKVLANGAAFSIAGNAGLLTDLLSRASIAEVYRETPFCDMVRSYSQALAAEYIKVYPDVDNRPPSCELLFCGYQKDPRNTGVKIPKIIKLNSWNHFCWNALATGCGYGFSGSKYHGAALYLQHRCYSENINLENAKCLAYCVVREVADMDSTVGGRIEMVVVTESGIEQFDGEKRYESRRKKLGNALKSALFG